MVQKHESRSFVKKRKLKTCKSETSTISFCASCYRWIIAELIRCEKLLLIALARINFHHGLQRMYFLTFSKNSVTKTFILGKIINIGPVRESNPGPLAPKARIMPLDQQAASYLLV